MVTFDASVFYIILILANRNEGLSHVHFLVSQCNFGTAVLTLSFTKARVTKKKLFLCLIFQAIFTLVFVKVCIIRLRKQILCASTYFLKKSVFAKIVDEYLVHQCSSTLYLNVVVERP